MAQVVAVTGVILAAVGVAVGFSSLVDSGTYYEAPPQRIPKFSAGVFSVCNKTGFADNNTVFHFFSRKSTAVESNGTHKDGYDDANEDLTYFIVEATSVTGSYSTFTIQKSEIKGW
ncbi:hypothetical protein F4782DRAFT_542924 [Xylaria castorea]|nr:hypothetical protein F4782DRAFT_542924 [Xylaria castorea]